MAICCVVEMCSLCYLPSLFAGTEQLHCDSLNYHSLLVAWLLTAWMKTEVAAYFQTPPDNKAVGRDYPTLCQEAIEGRAG